MGPQFTGIIFNNSDVIIFTNIGVINNRKNVIINIDVVINDSNIVNINSVDIIASNNVTSIIVANNVSCIIIDNNIVVIIIGRNNVDNINSRNIIATICGNNISAINISATNCSTISGTNTGTNVPALMCHLVLVALLPLGAGNPAPRCKHLALARRNLSGPNHQKVKRLKQNEPLCGDKIVMFGPDILKRPFQRWYEVIRPKGPW